ncbi:MAG: sulfur carrier protein ThiS [Bacteroidota bacterium]
MTIKINNQSQTLENSLSIKQTLTQFNLWEETGIAVAINEVVIPKCDWESRLLEDEDEVLVVTATQGG